jgi:YbbR domain-containing protein
MKWVEREQLRAAWQTVRSTVLKPERLRQAVTRNLGLKFLSLVIAFGLWSFVNFGERDTEQSLKVPLELRNIPAHLMITSPRIDFVDLRVTGPRTLLGRIDKTRLTVGLDLSGVRAGPAVFRVAAEALNLPRGVKVVRLNPSQVTLELERVGHKTVPVHVRLVGRPPPDLLVADTKVSPETVQVTGPASDVEEVHAVNTEAIDISKATAGTIERELPVDSLGDYISSSAERVAVQVHIEEVAVTREFKRVPIELYNAAAGLRLVPDAVHLTVRGPKRLVTSLDLPAGAVSVDVAGTGAADRMVKPTVELPVGVDLVAVDPAEVKLVALPTPVPTAAPKPRRRR